MSPGPARPGAVAACALPDWSLLLPATLTDGSYHDCFAVLVAGQVRLPDFIAAFCNTRLFRAERLVLRLAFDAGSTAADVEALAQGRARRFAAWRVSGRRKDQLLLRERTGRTMTWLACEAAPGGTILYLGSAVRPNVRQGGGTRRARFTSPILPFHRIYARALLRAAARDIG